MRYVILFVGALVANFVAALAASSIMEAYFLRGDAVSSLFSSVFPTFVLGLVPSTLCLLVMVALVDRARWWTPSAFGSLAALISGLVFRVAVAPSVAVMLVIVGAVGGFAFWPFWLWAERLGTKRPQE